MPNASNLNVHAWRAWLQYVSKPSHRTYDDSKSKMNDSGR